VNKAKTIKSADRDHTMPHSVCYLIDMSGDEFNNLMPIERQSPLSWIAELRLRKKFGVWDGMLVGNSTSFLVDVTGIWTLCILGYPYSALLAHDEAVEIRSKIAEWELALRRIAPFQIIYRIDDFLLEQWNARSDYLMTRSPETLQNFISWLHSQDSLYWTTIPADQQVASNPTAKMSHSV
jgi:hypothetical protein